MLVKRYTMVVSNHWTGLWTQLLDWTGSGLIDIAQSPAKYVYLVGH